MIWKSKSLQPILKIALPKAKCTAICFPKMARLILSGWSDDTIRFFSAENGKMVHKVPMANLGQPNVMITD